jgi:hypothetical protein
MLAKHGFHFFMLAFSLQRLHQRLGIPLPSDLTPGFGSLGLLAALPQARGRVIQTYVPLPGPLDKIELRRRTVSGRLGTLVIPFTIDGEHRTETIRL